MANEDEWRLRTKVVEEKSLSIVSDASAEPRILTGCLNEVSWLSYMMLASTLRRNHHVASALCMQQAVMALI